MNDVSLLEDEVTRYHYYLQLKLDVIEGRLRCNYEQAIVLSSYSLQVNKERIKLTVPVLERTMPDNKTPIWAYFPDDLIVIVN